MNVNPFSYLIEKLKGKVNVDFYSFGTSNNPVLDYNDINTAGIYWCYNKTGVTQNSPTNANGMLLVMNRNGVDDGEVQLYIDRNNATIYVRAFRGTWGAWRSL